MLFLWDCNCPSILLCSVLLIQLESLVLCAFGNSTMMSIAILVAMCVGKAVARISRGGVLVCGAKRRRKFFS